MILTKDVLKNFNPCSREYKEFCNKFPDGLDISAIWGTFDEANELWHIILADDLLKKQVGWSIYSGIIPAKIRANLSGANLRGAIGIEND